MNLSIETQERWKRKRKGKRHNPYCVYQKPCIFKVLGISGHGLFPVATCTKKFEPCEFQRCQPRIRPLILETTIKKQIDRSYGGDGHGEV